VKKVVEVSLNFNGMAQVPVIPVRIDNFILKMTERKSQFMAVTSKREGAIIHSNQPVP